MPTLVGKRAGVWVDSTCNNAEWIGRSDIPAMHYMYYRLQFTLDPAVDPAGFALMLRGASDDQLLDIWVNGSSLRDAGQLGSNLYGFGALQDMPSLSGMWQPDANEIIVAVHNQATPSGLLIQTELGAPLCQPVLDVTKATDTASARVGTIVEHTITVTNTQSDTTATNVRVTDDGANGDLAPLS